MIHINEDINDKTAYSFLEPEFYVGRTEILISINSLFLQVRANNFKGEATDVQMTIERK